MKHVISMRWLADPKQGCGRFPHIFYLIWISYSLSTWRFLYSLNGHIRPPQLCKLLSLEWLSYFEHVSPISSTHIFFLVYVLGATPNHIPLKYRCLIKISYRIRHVYHRPWKNWSTLVSHMLLHLLPRNHMTFGMRAGMGRRWPCTQPAVDQSGCRLNVRCHRECNCKSHWCCHDSHASSPGWHHHCR
jgi:hypothetical protein